MSQVDIRKIKSGDKITIEVEAIVRKDLVPSFFLYRGGVRHPIKGLSPACYTVVGHTPAPHVWKAGDKFILGTTQYTIVFFDEKSVLFDNIYGFRISWSGHGWKSNLDNIKLVEETAQ